MVVSYRAGYEIVAEAQSVPTQGALSDRGVLALRRVCRGYGVAYANGSPLSAGRRQSGPAQYTVDATSGTYGFSAADAGANDHDILRLHPRRSRRNARSNGWPTAIATRTASASASRSLGGQETTAYQNRPVPDFVAAFARQFPPHHRQLNHAQHRNRRRQMRSNARFAKLPDTVRDGARRERSRRSRCGPSAKVKDNLSGTVLQAKSGTLRDWISR